MILVDDHCHLTHELYKPDLTEVLKRAQQAGVKAIICSGVNPPTNRESLALAKKHGPLVRCSTGIYPLDAVGKGADSAGLSVHKGTINIDEEFAFIEKNKEHIAAIGEAGLDLHWEKDEKLFEQQKANFRKIIEFAKKLDKPLIVHSRRAERECLDLLEEIGIKTVVLHSFEARKSVIKRAVALGYHFSIPVTVIKSPQFQILAEMANINQIITETDGPWMSPVAGERNEPANIKLAVEKIAEIKGFTVEETANTIWMNFQHIYG